MIKITLVTRPVNSPSISLPPQRSITALLAVAVKITMVKKNVSATNTTAANTSKKLSPTRPSISVACFSPKGSTIAAVNLYKRYTTNILTAGTKSIKMMMSIPTNPKAFFKSNQNAAEKTIKFMEEE